MFYLAWIRWVYETGLRVALFGELCKSNPEGQSLQTSGEESWRSGLSSKIKKIRIKFVHIGQIWRLIESRDGRPLVNPAWRQNRGICHTKSLSKVVYLGRFEKYFHIQGLSGYRQCLFLCFLFTTTCIRSMICRHVGSTRGRPSRHRQPECHTPTCESPSGIVIGHRGISETLAISW